MLHEGELELTLERGAGALGGGGEGVAELAAGGVGEELGQWLLDATCAERAAKGSEHGAKRLAGQQRRRQL